MKLKTQFGRSMIEMLGVLAVIGVLSVGGLVAYSKAMQTYKVNEAVSYINNVRMELKTRKITGTYTPGATYTCVSWMGGSLPPGVASCRIIHSMGRIILQFNSSSVLREVAKKFNTANSFHYTDAQIDASTMSWSCYELATGRWYSEYIDLTLF